MLEFNATLIVAMISFIVFMVIMNAILYKPISRIQKEREEFIAAENKAKQVTVDKIESLKNHYNDIIETTKEVAKKNFSKTVSEYKDRKESIITGAKALAKKDMEIAQAKLDGDVRVANTVLETQINTLASKVVSKVLGEDVKIQD